MNCGHRNPDYHKFCSTCGESLDKTLCRCGSVCEFGAGFCGMCGQAMVIDEVKAAGRASNKVRLKDVLSSEPCVAVSNEPTSTSMSQTDIENFFKK